MESPQAPQSSLELLNLLLIQTNVAILCLLGGIALLQGFRVLQMRLLGLAAFSLAALSFVNMPLINMLPRPVTNMLAVCEIPNVGLVWWFCQSILRDDYQLTKFQWIGMVAFSVVPTLYVLDEAGLQAPLWELVNVLGSVMPFAMISHISWIAISGRNMDLLEPRRRARYWLVSFTVGASAISLLSESIVAPIYQSLLIQSLVLPGVVGLFFWLSAIDSSRLLFAPSVKREGAESNIDPKQISLHRKLLEAMDEGQMYLVQGLTVSALAEELGVPDHQLRQLINSSLGFRNFADFIAKHRIAHAKELLADASQARKTMIQIAFASGFSSLQTFNRVFKKLENKTPTSHRNESLIRHLNHELIEEERES